MAEVKLMKGNEAIAEAAVRSGCRAYFGYPITPQNEVIEYMARRMPEVNGVCLQAESEIAAINMVFGAAAAGDRAMTSSSGPGISLKQEGISYLAAGELPCVIVNIQRAGPGLGGITPAQADYFQATKGGGHGDYHTVVLAPASVQEAFEMTVRAFDLADQYRIPVLILGDGAVGQMMEKVELRSFQRRMIPKPWAATGRHGRQTNNIVKTLYLKPEELEDHNNKLQAKYREITSKEADWEACYTEDADLVLVAYGIMARIAQSAMNIAREQGHKVGMIRPKTLWPFPITPFKNATKNTKGFLVLELSAGQMVEDVLLAVEHKKPVSFFGRTGGMIPTTKEVLDKSLSTMGQKGERLK
ncbi:MAG TPA: 3-methyl-2-oxobutanoate dehydrogenase subunit VorB [Nitrospirota bacterium]|nr:3-methyl-2-oxobutanoate dehydrogenase subunit VorB [Nitrospirota bacterium]